MLILDLVIASLVAFISMMLVDLIANVIKDIRQ